MDHQQRAREYGDSNEKMGDEDPRDKQPVPQHDQEEEVEEEGEGNIDDFIEILEQHQKECEVNGKYVEAEMAKNRIAELKDQKKNKESDELKIRQQNDCLELEETHIMEFNQFNQTWDQRMNEFQQHGMSLIKQLEDKHIQQLELYAQDLEKDLPTNFKPSAELLNLRKIQLSLAKQKNYTEAHQVQFRSNKQEKREMREFDETREKKKMILEQKLIKQQENEMSALRAKIEAGENEQKKQRALELEKMFLRYQNVKKELENKHKLERQRLEKGDSFDPQASIMASRQMSRQSKRSKQSARMRQ